MTRESRALRQMTFADPLKDNPQQYIDWGEELISRPGLRCDGGGDDSPPTFAPLQNDAIYQDKPGFKYVEGLGWVQTGRGRQSIEKKPLPPKEETNEKPATVPGQESGTSNMPEKSGHRQPVGSGRVKKRVNMKTVYEWSSCMTTCVTNPSRAVSRLIGGECSVAIHLQDFSFLQCPSKALG